MRLAATAASVTAVLAVWAPAAQARAHHHRRHHRGHTATRIARIAPSSPIRRSDAGPPAAGPSTETAGKVASFSEGVLTLTLADGSTVRGRVTSETEISCERPEATARMAEDGGSGSDGGGEREAGEDRERAAEDESGDDDGRLEAGSCDTTSLESGTLVHEAELRIAPSGSVFTEIELVG